jgi:hypothetical protein
MVWLHAGGICFELFPRNSEPEDGSSQLADFRNRANEDCQHLESRRREDLTDGALPCDAQAIDLMHSQREGVMKTQKIKWSLSREVKNCLTRYARNYSVRSAYGSGGKPIRAEAWGIVLAGSALQINYVIIHDIATHRPLHSPPLQNAGTIDNTMLVQTSYVIMATKTGPHAVSTILPIA